MIHDETHMPSRRRFAASLAAASALIAPAVAVAAKAAPDPIFAAIEAHKVHDKIIHALELQNEGNSQYFSGAQFREAVDSEEVCFFALLKCKPTTLQGLLDFVAYVRGTESFAFLEASVPAMENIEAALHHFVEAGRVA